MINRLAYLRKAQGYSQEGFAKKLGVTSASLSNWENEDFDLRKLKYIYLELICEILNIKIEDLFKEEK